MNHVDAASRAELRELNELNFARFEARMDQRFAEFSAVFQEFARSVDRQLAEIRLEMKEQQVVQMRWMVGMWLALMVAVMGLWIRR